MCCPCPCCTPLFVSLLVCLSVHCFPVLVVLASHLQQALAPRDIEEMLEVGHTVTSWGAGGVGRGVGSPLLYLNRIFNCHARARHKNRFHIYLICHWFWIKVSQICEHCAGERLSIVGFFFIFLFSCQNIARTLIPVVYRNAI